MRIAQPERWNTLKNGKPEKSYNLSINIYYTKTMNIIKGVRKKFINQKGKGKIVKNYH